MKKGGGKAKGSQFERDVCKGFSLWVSGGFRKDVFWRTAMSGGRATVHKRRGELQRQSGDMCAVAPEGHVLTSRFFFEFKSYKLLQLPQFFLKGTGLLADFWNKAREEARDYSKSPVLIARQDRLPAFVVTCSGASSILKLVGCEIPVLLAQIPVCGVDDFDFAEIVLLEDLLASRYVQPSSRIRERLNDSVAR